jgi:hypothetical protein
LDTSGDSYFVVNGAPYPSREIDCHTLYGAPCAPNGPITVHWGSGGPAEIRVDAGCPTIGTVSESLQIKVGLEAPAEISGPYFGCSGTNINLTATQELSAYSYTWSVPNSTWKVNGVNGSQTIVGDQGRAPTITVGSSTGNVGVRANMEACLGNNFRYKNISVSTSAPSAITNFTGPSFGCSTTNVTFYSDPASGANSYLLTIRNAQGQYLGELSNSSPSFTFRPDSYTIFTDVSLSLTMAASNICGYGTSSTRSFFVINCSSGTSMYASPNPTDQSTEVTIELNPDELGLSNQMTFQEFNNMEIHVALISEVTNLTLYKAYKRGRKFQIETKEIPDGKYVLKASGNNFSISKHIVVQHK